MNDLKVCFVIPCYNEGGRLITHKFVDYVHQNSSVSFCFVNDGSSDETENILIDMDKLSENLFYINNSENQGKAASVRNGILSVVDDYKYVGYLDADLATPLEEIERFLYELEGDAEVNTIFGSRVLKLGSKIERRFKRHLFGRLFATLVSGVFGIKCYDSQCGAKLFRSESAKVAFKEALISNWIFDVELLIRLRNADELEKVSELPLKKWEDVAGSKIGFSDVIRIPLEVLRLYKNYK
jgi:dolichyl-phosphate beta-glucosyltransferase